MKRIVLAAAVLAGVVGSLPAHASSIYGGTPTLSGDTSGPLSATVTSKLNGTTPGGTCPTGQFANSVSASGVPSCATPSGTASGVGFGSGTPTTNRYYPFLAEIYQTGVTGSSATTRCHTVTPPRTTTVKGLETWVLTGVTSANIQMGLYNTTADGSAATTLIDNTPSIPATASGASVQGSLSSPRTLQANTLYALCVQVDNGSLVLDSSTTSVAQISGFSSTNATPRSGVAGYTGYTYTMAFGTWTPDLTGASSFAESITLTPTAFMVAN